MRIIETAFFIFMAYISAIISDLEYSYYEQHNILKFTDALEYRLVVGTFIFVLYSSFYWLLLKRLVFQKKVVWIIVSSIAFIPVYHLYSRYIMYGAISRMPFVSASLRAKALNELHPPHLYFAINYLLSIVLLPMIGFAFLMRSLQQDRQLKTLQEQRLLAELSYLKAQLHPHFFLNTINNIYALALRQSADTAPMVAGLGGIMRYILYEADGPSVSLGREIGFLQEYIALEKIRHRRNDIRFDVQGNDPSVQVAPLLLLPFVENAFKHGLEHETGAGYVHIVLCQDETALTLEVANSRPAAAAGPASNGIGLENVKKRLAILYPGRYRLALQDRPDEYRVTLTLHIDDQLSIGR